TSPWQQLLRVLRFARVAASVLGVLVVAFVLQEAASLVRGAASVHWSLGWLMAMALGAAAALLVGMPIARYFRAPRIALPPKLPDDRAPSPRELGAAARYLEAVLVNATRHPLLEREHARIAAARDELAGHAARVRLAAPADCERLHCELAAWAERALPPIW